MIDRTAQHSCAALAITRAAGEHPTRSTESFPGLQARAKPQALRVAIKVKGKILFVNLPDVVSVQAKGKCVCLQRNASSYLLRESISVVAEKLENHGFHPHPPICAREHFVCRRDQAAFDGRILPASRGRQGIYRHTYLQEKSQMPCAILDRHRSVLPWLILVVTLPTASRRGQISRWPRTLQSREP